MALITGMDGVVTILAGTHGIALQGKVCHGMGNEQLKEKTDSGHNNSQ